MRKIKFTKMHGAGNDYIYVYTPLCAVSNPAQVAIELSRPHFGVGSDGLILIGESRVADFSMRMFNNDGSEGRMCGNGIRCVAKYVYDKRLTDKREISIETLSGVKMITVGVGGDGAVETARVDMGVATLTDQALCAADCGALNPGTVAGYEGTFVSMGNPHFVIFVDDCESLDITAIGPRLECQEVFPQKCNIEFATLRTDGSIRMRVWERGSGVTMACGTGACATAVAACLRGLAGRQSDVQMDGGLLHIEWLEDGRVMMTGPAATVFEGEAYVSD